MQIQKLNEHLISEIIIQSLKETKDFQLLVNNITSKIKICNPFIDYRSTDFHLVINVFYKWNIFNIRNSIRDVADSFNCSRVTVYNRINEIINNGELSVQ